MKFAVLYKQKQFNNVTLTRNIETGVFVLSLNSPTQNSENRWTLAMCKAVHAAFDILEEELEKDEPGTNAALCVQHIVPFQPSDLTLHLCHQSHRFKKSQVFLQWDRYNLAKI